jgi:phthalate 4,5-dioxygenase oxygenase subunit
LKAWFLRRLAGGRLAAGDNIYWRIAQFPTPVHSYAPSSMPGENIFGQSFVPVTDTNCWIYTYAWNPERPLTEAERDGYASGNGVMAVVDENYVPLRNKANDYLIDRALQKTKSYSGIKGVSEQDAAPAHLAHQDRYAVRSGACVTDKAKELSAVMVERFGEATGYVGRRRNAAAE